MTKFIRKTGTMIAAIAMFLSFSVLSSLAVSTNPVQSQQDAAQTQITTPTSQQVNSKLQENPIIKDLNILINFMTGVVGIVVVGTIIAGGIEYSMAGNNPQKVTNARKRIANGILAMFVFLLMWAFVNWLVPGGIF